MAKVLLSPIGQARERVLDEATWERQRTAMQTREERVNKARAEVRDGWGERGRERVHRKGKLNTWERLDLLRDEGAPLLAVGTLVNYVFFEVLEFESHDAAETERTIEGVVSVLTAGGAT